MRKLFIFSFALLSVCYVSSCVKEEDPSEVAATVNSSNGSSTNTESTGNENTGSTETDTTSTGNTGAGTDTTATDTTMTTGNCLYLMQDESLLNWGDCAWDDQQVQITYILNGVEMVLQISSVNSNTPIVCGNISSYTISGCSGEELDPYDPGYICNACDDLFLEFR